MRWNAVWWAVCVAPLSGCNLAYYTGHNISNESVSRVDEYRLASRLRSEAKAAWYEVCRQHAGRSFTAEFAEGFAEGYVDYLEHGGTPRPPAVPPPRFRRSSYLSPEGHALAKDYLSGFQYGAEVACATGRRQFLTVPVLISQEQPEQPLNIVQSHSSGPSVESIPAPVPLPDPVLPPLPNPKPIPAPDLPPKKDPIPDPMKKDPLPPVDLPKLPDPGRSQTLPPVRLDIPAVIPVSVDLPASSVPPVLDRPPPLPPVPDPPK